MRSGLASHEQTKFAHTSGAFAGLWLPLWVVLAPTVAVELLPAALALLLEALDDIDGAAHVTLIRVATIVAISGGHS